jgi:hypothetical protein
MDRSPFWHSATTSALYASVNSRLFRRCRIVSSIGEQPPRGRAPYLGCPLYRGKRIYQLRLIDGQIQEVEAAIGAVLEEWPAQERTVLASFPGMTARQAVLLACIGDPACFRNDRQLRKLLGWYPEARESGSTLSKHRLGRSGNRMARRELWLWAWELISPTHADTPFQHYYRRLRDRGMTGKVAMGHLAGKLISVIFHCLRSGVAYDPQRHARDLGIVDAWGSVEA